MVYGLKRHEEKRRNHESTRGRARGKIQPGDITYRENYRRRARGLVGDSLCCRSGHFYFDVLLATSSGRHVFEEVYRLAITQMFRGGEK